MVSIKWTGGRTGNDLFQYIFSRLLAIKNNLHLETEWPHQDFVEMHPFVGGEKHDKPVVEVRDMYHDPHEKEWFSTSLAKKHLITHGFFQHPKYYDKNKRLVKSFFNLKPIQKRPPEHIVIHWRLGDYYKVGNTRCENCIKQSCYGCRGGSVINPSWYAGVLMQKLRFNLKKHKLYIVTDDPGDPILTKLQRFKPEIISKSPKHDFHFIRDFDTIICGNSSFSFWASYLSDAKRIYTFSRWVNEPHNYIIRLAYFHNAMPVNGQWL